MRERLFTLAGLDNFVPADHPRWPIRALINEALGGLNEPFNSMYTDAKRRLLEAGLRTGIGELQHFQREAARKTATLWPLIQEASQKLAQARADFAVL